MASTAKLFAASETLRAAIVDVQIIAAALAAARRRPPRQVPEALTRLLEGLTVLSGLQKDAQEQADVAAQEKILDSIEKDRLVRELARARAASRPPERRKPVAKKRAAPTLGESVSASAALRAWNEAAALSPSVMKGWKETVQAEAGVLPPEMFRARMERRIAQTHLGELEARAFRNEKLREWGPQYRKVADERAAMLATEIATAKERLALALAVAEKLDDGRQVGPARGGDIEPDSVKEYRKQEERIAAQREADRLEAEDAKRLSPVPVLQKDCWDGTHQCKACRQEVQQFHRMSCSIVARELAKLEAQMRVKAAVGPPEEPKPAPEESDEPHVCDDECRSNGCTHCEGCGKEQDDCTCGTCTECGCELDDDTRWVSADGELLDAEPADTKGCQAYHPECLPEDFDAGEEESDADAA